MAPEGVVGLVLGNPVFVHVFEQIKLSEAFKECADIGAGVGWDLGAIGEAGGGVWGGGGVVLTSMKVLLVFGFLRRSGWSWGFGVC